MKWACPKCGAAANEHGKGGAGDCKDWRPGRSYCNGFLCECDGDTGTTHGESLAEPCPDARCYHCNWAGEFPKPPAKAQAWEKKALAAGWTPPKGWGY